MTNKRVKQLRKEYFKSKVRDPESINQELVDAEGRLLTLSQDYQKRVNEAAIALGLPAQVPEGNIRLYRGVQQTWNPADNLPNAFWSPKAEIASNFAEAGEVWVCDVANTDIHRIPGGDLGDWEVQIPDPSTTRNAILVMRANQLPNKKGELPPPTLKQRLSSILDIKPPKPYKKIT